MTVTIGTTTFDHVDYDVVADVLYLHVGDPADAVDFDESPEGHALRFDQTGRLIGVSVVGARSLVQRDEPLCDQPVSLTPALLRRTDVVNRLLDLVLSWRR